MQPDEVMHDFYRKFDNTRFCNEVKIIREDHEQGIIDSTIVGSVKSKNNAWKKVNSIMGICDRIATEDTSCVNSFYISSKHSDAKYWIAYNSEDKIKAIRIIIYKPTLHSALPPCND